MTLRRPLLAAVLALGAAGPAARASDAPEAAAAPSERIETAIRRGVEYLLSSQNRDGSWGTPASNLWDIYAPIPGSYYAFQVASSALALSALLEAGGEDEKTAAAVRRGTDFLVEHHGVRRVSQETLYNTWAHAYALEAFARLLAREKDGARTTALRRACDRAVDLLGRFEFVDGGWGYYDFDVGAQRPGPGATPFTTATVLAALKAVEAHGIAVPKRLVDRAVRLIRTCEKPDGAFAYSFEHRFAPSFGINKVKGSLARTPACLVALRAAGELVTEARAKKALDELETFGHFLRIARKYPIPHESWYLNSGYFCFYGYYYATSLVESLPKDARAAEYARLAARLTPLQEKDGSFWDYQLYGYHKAYGTGYVVLSLARCRAR